MGLDMGMRNEMYLEMGEGFEARLIWWIRKAKFIDGVGLEIRSRIEYVETLSTFLI